MRASATLVPLFFLLLLAPFADAGRVSLAPARAVAPLDSDASPRPLAMTTADLDGDRLTDLVVGFADGGSGTIVVYRTNRDALWPNGPRARERWGAEIPPFLPAARTWVGERPDRLVAGDFDNDGKVDVVFATSGSRVVWLLPGTRVGEFGAPRRYDMPGQVTALASGEYGRADGLADLAIAVDAGDAAQFLVFGDPQGALHGAPEVHALPQAATEISLADLDGDLDRDASALAGSEIVVVRGRDRKLTWPEAQRSAVPPAVVERHALGADARGFAIGRVIEPGRNGLVWLDGEGRAGLARGGAPGRIETRSAERSADFVLVAGLSGSEGQDVVLIEREARRLRVRRLDGGEETIGLPGRPIGAVALRLNADAVDDLVVLQEPPEAPIVVLLSTPITVFLVTNTNATGLGSLRQAVTDANAKPGIDAVHFDIPGTPPFLIGCSGSHLPVTDTVTIDATTQPGYAGEPIVNLYRSTTDCDGGIRVTASSSALYGLEVGDFPTAPNVDLEGSGNSVQGCLLRYRPVGVRAGGIGFHEIGGVAPNNLSSSEQVAVRTLAGTTYSTLIATASV
jgi:FG-GAP-like repeat